MPLPVSNTLSDHHICHGIRPLGRHVNNVSFSSLSVNRMSMDSIIEVFPKLRLYLWSDTHISIT